MTKNSVNLRGISWACLASECVFDHNAVSVDKLVSALDQCPHLILLLLCLSILKLAAYIGYHLIQSDQWMNPFNLVTDIQFANLLLNILYMHLDRRILLNLYRFRFSEHVPRFIFLIEEFEQILTWDFSWTHFERFRYSWLFPQSTITTLFSSDYSLDYSLSNFIII